MTSAGSVDASPGSVDASAPTSGPSSAPLVLILSGPNLNLLGKREPEIYGSETLADHVAAASKEAEVCRLRVEHHQTNHEGELVELVQAASASAAALIVNAGALTHYSWSLHDAIAAFKSSTDDAPVVEVHLSNPQARERWRHESVLAPVADGTIAGFGGLGYVLAIQAIARLLRGRKEAAALDEVTG